MTAVNAGFLGVVSEGCAAEASVSGVSAVDGSIFACAGLFESESTGVLLASLVTASSADCVFTIACAESFGALIASACADGIVALFLQ